MSTARERELQDEVLRLREDVREARKAASDWESASNDWQATCRELEALNEVANACYQQNHAGLLEELDALRDGIDEMTVLQRRAGAVNALRDLADSLSGFTNLSESIRERAERIAYGETVGHIQGGFAE